MAQKLDYKKIGLKCGIEIHQQLNTHKLFCECPSEIDQDKPDFTTIRKLRPVAGETGIIDIAAAFEKKKKLTYIYEGYDHTTCPVEWDEEPPHPINQEALDIALTIALLLDCEVPKTAQVMRKTVVDGSNTSGFQRTVLVGLNGHLKTSFGKVGIPSIYLEEDSARRTAETKDTVTFRLDRLGIPLVEIGTDPDAKIPEQGQEIAEKLGSLLRSTGMVKRGIGTIRQDVNVSVRGGHRVELKGVQDLKLIPEMIKIEAQRQLELVKKKEKFHPEVRNVKPDGTSKFLRPMPGAARMYPETDVPLIHIADARIKKLRKKLPEPLEKKAQRFIKAGMSKDLAEQLISSPYIFDFETLLKKFKTLPSNLLAKNFLSISSEVRKKTGKDYHFTIDEFKAVHDRLNKKKITKEAILEVFIGLSRGQKLKDLEKKYAKLSDAQLRKEVQRLKKQFKAQKLPENAIIGKTMAQLRGKADPQKIMKFLKS